MLFVWSIDLMVIFKTLTEQKNRSGKEVSTGIRDVMRLEWMGWPNDFLPPVNRPRNVDAYR
jgi:hypothetical protein